MDLLKLLKKESKHLSSRLSAIESAISAMTNTYIKKTTAHSTAAKPRKKRKLSEAGRLAIGRAAKARWAKQKAAQKKTEAAKQTKAKAKPAKIAKIKAAA
jgi:hypothetical protein